MGGGWAKGRIKIFGKEDAQKTQSFPGGSGDFPKQGVGSVAQPLCPRLELQPSVVCNGRVSGESGGQGAGRREGTWGRAPPAQTRLCRSALWGHLSFLQGC